MPRVPLTLEEKSARHAQRHNQRQRDALPIFMESGLEADLIDKGLIVDKAPQAQLRQNEAYFDHIETGRRAAAGRALMYQKVAKMMLPDYRALLLHHRHMRQRFTSLREPYARADFWMTCLEKHLDHQTFLNVLDVIRPDHAEVLRAKDRYEARARLAQSKGEYNPWVVNEPKKKVS